MGKQKYLHRPQVGMATRQGARSADNNDQYDYFEVDRREITTRLPAPLADGDEKTTPLNYQRMEHLLTTNQAADVYVAVVADGVTSTAGGAQASKLAVQAVRATLQEPPSRHETLSEWLEFAIMRANEEILFEGKRNPEWQGMSTTIVLAALVGEKLYVMHLGDSRAYLLRDGKLYQLTADHTWTQEALNAGSITVAEASQHPGRNQLLRYLGSQRSIAVDRGIIAPGTTQREEYLLAQPGDMLLLCTDGLHHLLSPDEIRQTLVEHTGYPQDAVDELISRAVEKGERDDITAILLELPMRLATPAALPAPTAQVTSTGKPETPRSYRLAVILIVLALLVLLVLLAMYWLS
jgi:serine/threonine protein phosphatase PrpC